MTLIFLNNSIDLKSTIRFIYFDVDDTILDHKSAERAALQLTHDHFAALKCISIQELWHHYHTNNIKLWQDYGRGKIDRPFLEYNRFARTLRDLNISSIDPDEMRAFYMQSYQDNWRWIDHAQTVLDELYQIYPIGFLTNGFRELQRAKADQFKLWSYTKHYVISEEVGHMKPSHQIFEFATKLVNVPANEILYVGDSFTSDILGGSTFGWKTAWYTKSQDPESIKQATFVFDDLLKLPDLIQNVLH